MGRRKNYERATLLQRALGVFHRRGYRGATTERLVGAMRVNRNSVYSEFGSKAGLMVAALEQYEHIVVEPLFGPLEGAGATLDQIEALFAGFTESAVDAAGLGCLVCNVAAELGDTEAALKPYVQRHFSRLEAAFRNALCGAVAAAQIAPKTSIDSEASFLMACCLGIFIRVRSGAEPKRIASVIEATLRHLTSLRQTAGRRVSSVSSHDRPASQGKRVHA